MGANAQTSVPTFVASQVLTAQQQNDSARTGVPVFASTVTRDAGFGGSGEKTLAEGQLCYVEGTGLQTYNGSSWITWGTGNGLTLISSTTIGSAVSSVTISSAFSSTYDNYLVILSGGAASTGLDLRLTLGATASNYYWAREELDFSSAASVITTANPGTYVPVATGDATSLNAVFNILMPNLAENTVILSQGYLAPQGGSGWCNAYLADTTAYTAFTLTTSTGTVTGGTVKLYGYQN